MRIIAIYLLCFLSSLNVLPVQAAEIIHHYDTQVTVLGNGSLDIIETIEVTAEGQDIRRGIYRDFPMQRRTYLGGILSSMPTIISVKKRWF